MFDFFRRKKQAKVFNPRQEVVKLTELSPPSTLVYMPKQGSTNGELEDLGKAFLLRREKKLYSEGSYIYITTPENLKIAKDQSLNVKMVTLQFMHRRVPYRIECRILGRFRLLPEVIETLDFNAKAAYKLTPISPVKKQEQRQFMRFTLKNYGDSRIPLTTHISFDLYIKTTNHEFPPEGAPPLMLNDLQAASFLEQDEQRSFTTRDSINEFRDLMLKKQPHDRYVYVSKVLKDASGSMVKKPDIELLLGRINILGLEMESLRDVLYLKKSEKAGLRKGKDNQYNLHTGEKILTRFTHKGTHYEMVCEVMEARTQNEVVRPLEYMRSESGLKVELVDYSIGGCLIESSPDLLKFVLGDQCPPKVEDEADFEGEYWEKTFELLRKSIIYLSFYPTSHFPDAIKRFEPELPFKICILGQIVRTHMARIGERKTLQHGVQFAYDARAIPLEVNEIVPWRYTRLMQDNEHFKEVHSHLTQLYGYLENQSLASGTLRPSSSVQRSR